ncbi:MAG: glycosyltransferase family 2 protein [Desulfuromonadaceae bacterium]
MKVSIITVCYNSEAFIQDAIASVAAQRYQNFEHIIVDGGSTDDTLGIINRHRSCFSNIVSEPDDGMYDAMNKGIALATGEIVGILNADDFYAHANVINDIAAIFKDSFIDACYGDLEYVDSLHTNKVLRYWRSGDYLTERFYHGWMPPHPTFFVRRSLYGKYGSFKLELGSSADYELMLRFLLKHRARAAYIPDVLVKMRTGGASNASLRNRLKANSMDRLAWRINGLRHRPWTIYMKPLSKLGQFFKRKSVPE